MLPIAISGTLPACLTVCSLVSSKDIRKLTPEYALKNTPNCTWWKTSSLLDHSLPSTLSRCLQVHSKYTPIYTSKSLSSMPPIAVDCTLPAYMAPCSQLSCQEGRHFQSHLTIWLHVCFCIFNWETCRVAGTGRCEAVGVWGAEIGGWLAGKWHGVCGMWRLADSICWLKSWCQSIW